MSALPTLAVLTLCAVLTIPVLGLGLSWLQGGEQSRSVLGGLAQTVLWDYSVNSALLCLGVGIGVAATGLATATCVALFDFWGRRFWQWALLLPLAMPAYVLAYAYTDFLQFSGPAQTWIRTATGLEGRVLPEVRSLWGATQILVCALYPYVYLLVRAALAEHALRLMEAAQVLGAHLPRRLGRVALPLARPALAAGVALALMECLADYGVVSYFGVQTYTTGIYKAWLAMDARAAAAQLCSLLLLLVAALLWAEKRAQARLRFGAAQGAAVAGQTHAQVQPQRLPLRGRWNVLAVLICATPVFLGFVLPILFMLRPLLQAWSEFGAPSTQSSYWLQFSGWAWHSLRLGVMTAILALLLALVLSSAQRLRPSVTMQVGVQLASLGYAVPGAVVVVGLLLPLMWLQLVWPGNVVGVLFTGTAWGLIWAYLVRFCAVALQPLQAAYQRIPSSYDEAARTLGQHSGVLLRRIHLPLLRRPAAVALLLVLVDVMKELPVTLVLRPFNSDTLAVAAYQFARDERLGEAALPALALVLVGLIPVWWLSRSLDAGSRQ